MAVNIYVFIAGHSSPAMFFNNGSVVTYTNN
jgi:hypothetical protein